MRKSRFVVMSLLASAVLASCGGGGGKDGSTASSSDCPVSVLAEQTGKTKVVFWHAMGQVLGDELKKITDEFNSSQDKVEVELVFQGSYDDTITKYQAALRAKSQLPDLVQLEETQLQFAIDSKSFTPVAACIKADSYDTTDFLERVISYFTVEGTQWAMPFNTSNPVLYYNKAKFVAAGLDPDKPPATLDEVKQVSQKLVDAGVVKHGIVLEFQPWYFEQILAKEGVTMLNNGNGRTKRATAATYDSPEAQEIWAWLDDMVKSGLAQSVGRNPQGIDHFLSIASGDSAMTISTSAALGAIKAAIAAGQGAGVEIGVAQLPSLTNDPAKGGAMVGGAELWMGKGSTDAVKAATWEYLKYLDSPEVQAQWHAATGYLPIRRSATELPAIKDLWTSEPAYRVAYDQLNDGTLNDASGGIVMGPYKEVRDLWKNAMEILTTTDQDPQTILDKLQADVTAKIQDYNDRIGA